MHYALEWVLFSVPSHKFLLMSFFVHHIPEKPKFTKSETFNIVTWSNKKSYLKYAYLCFSVSKIMQLSCFKILMEFFYFMYLFMFLSWCTGIKQNEIIRIFTSITSAIRQKQSNLGKGPTVEPYLRPNNKNSTVFL